jgi:alpha-beta hydrolase superfamily lysophospholipase
MANFIDSLKQNFQVIAISTRGHGKSEIGSLPITYEKKPMMLWLLSMP